MSPTNVFGSLDRAVNTPPPSDTEDLQEKADKAELDARDLEANEAFPTRVKKAPMESSREERAEHEILHEPNRSWCRACVAGRRRSDAHFARTNVEKQFPTVGID